ncbi:MAG: L-seryl-tRNA(Sec) selenium transferase [Gammaproteobacteria bacterium]|nr:L-seryl-tRNA(Sec) selenium transferase [Gammaproteobacteria bacterium]MYI21488.1 L-seryl-tRNA(Sec) selenium transferase [Gammaproteobacteria bacterium]
MTDPRRGLPGVDRVLASTAFAALLATHPRQRIVHHLRSALDHAREDLARGTGHAPPDIGDLAREVERALILDGIPSLRPVINATGVVLHTNLGRAPIAPAARSAMARAARGYGNLEFDLERGSRGSRYVHCVQLLRELTGAEAALVVNNAAGALVLGMNTLAAEKEVAVSRGELVEIGGGFRIPEILVRSGVRLREVGSTNRTRIADYEAALETGEVAALLKVHRSNFRIEGFTEEAGVAEVAELADRLGVHFFHDLGTGLMMDPAALGLPGEPRAADSLANGAHVVGFSGDKLLGGPQAGILVGRREPIARMRQNPLCRSLRVDKVTLAGLEATLRLYRDPGRALREIPALRMIAASPRELLERATRLAAALEARGVPARVSPGTSLVGGGTCPGVALDTFVVEPDTRARSVSAVAGRLRRGDPPVLARVEDDRLSLDPRTVEPEEEALLVERVVRACLPDED